METELEEAEGESVSPPALLCRFNSSIFKRGASQGYRQWRYLTDMLFSDLSFNVVCALLLLPGPDRLLFLLYVLFLSCFRMNYTQGNGCFRHWFDHLQNKRCCVERQYLPASLRLWNISRQSAQKMVALYILPTNYMPKFMFWALLMFRFGLSTKTTCLGSCRDHVLASYIFHCLAIQSKISVFWCHKHGWN